jgi:rare lipoprotein A
MRAMTKTRPPLLILALGLALAGCGTAPTKTSQTEDSPVIPPYKGGGYYKDDGPGANPPANLADIPDAVPRAEPLHRFANDAYKVLGKKYTPLTLDTPYKAKGLASWYGRKFHGKPTSTGEPYDMYAMSAAHATLPLPSYAKVTNLENGKSVVVRVNDRGPFHDGRIVDLSYTAAYKLDILKGVTPVEVEALAPDAAPDSFTAQAQEETVPAVALPPAEAVAAATVPAPSPASPTFARDDKAIYLQLGAYANPVTADNLLARASARLSRQFPGVMRLEANGLYKVQAGPFANVEEADRAASQVQADLGIKAYKVMPAPAVAAPVPSPGVYLQLGALSSPEAAAALAERVKTRLGSELPGLSQVNAGALIKVQAGPFASPDAAEKLAQAYLQNFGVKPYKIVR